MIFFANIIGLTTSNIAPFEHILVYRKMNLVTYFYLLKIHIKIKANIMDKDCNGMRALDMSVKENFPQNRPGLYSLGPNVM